MKHILLASVPCGHYFKDGVVLFNSSESGACLGSKLKLSQLQCFLHSDEQTGQDFWKLKLVADAARTAAGIYYIRARCLVASSTANVWRSLTPQSSHGNFLLQALQGLGLLVLMLSNEAGFPRGMHWQGQAALALPLKFSAVVQNHLTFGTEVLSCLHCR